MQSLSFFPVPIASLSLDPTPLSKGERREAAAPSHVRYLPLRYGEVGETAQADGERKRESASDEEEGKT